MMKKRCQYGKYYIDYSLVRADRKTLKITVYPTSEIVITAPNKASLEEVEAFIQRKWLWIHKQLCFFGKYKKKTYEKEYVSGESFLYLGRQYKLLVRPGSTAQVKLQKGKLYLQTTGAVRDSAHNKKILNKWFRARAVFIFNQRMNIVSQNFRNTEMPELCIQKMNKRWGSYVTNKKIILNPILIHASKDCIDYVITHELCHFEQKRHDKHFYKLLNKKFLDWEKVKEKLELRYS